MQFSICLSVEDYVVIFLCSVLGEHGSDKALPNDNWPLLPATVQRGHDVVVTAKPIPV